jgi:hypothetical protein
LASGPIDGKSVTRFLFFFKLLRFLFKTHLRRRGAPRAPAFYDFANLTNASSVFLHVLTVCHARLIVGTWGKRSPQEATCRSIASRSSARTRVMSLVNSTIFKLFVGLIGTTKYPVTVDARLDGELSADPRLVAASCQKDRGQLASSQVEIVMIGRKRIIHKLIAAVVTTAFLALPACAGPNDTKGTPKAPSIGQKKTPALQDAPRPGSSAEQRDDIIKGLSRNPEDCNQGCIDSPP